ncbi:phage tailspike protein [Enterobacter hormaechei]|uniref:phage tailspike protein n=1 Tax=Enterobacter hormaechei TaxID=158836 RepID=UPI0034D2CC51
MSSLVTSPTPQFINPLFGNVCADAKIFIGKVNTDALNPANRQSVYILKRSDQTTPEKTEIPQPLVTNSAGVIVYEGLPVTPWVDGAYSITIIGYDGAQLYTSFYVDDPTYWLRLDLATEPKKTADGKHYDPNDDHGVNMVAGAAPIFSPDFTGTPTAPTPPAGDSSTRIATTAFVQAALSSAVSVGLVGTCQWWPKSSPPTGAVVLDGSSLSKSAYPEAYAVVGDTYATQNGLVPDSQYFIIPDCRSRYFRGYDRGAGISPYADFLKKYDDMLEQHTHETLVSGWEGDGAHRETGALLYGTHGDGNDVELITSSFGGSETMPKTIVMLPIMWVTAPHKVATALWHINEDYASQRPVIHHYSPETGELLSSSYALPSPVSPGEWLIPAHATLQTPPAMKSGHAIIFKNGTWQHDAELFEARQAAIERLKQTRERENQLLAQKAERREEMNAWLKSQGAPFTLDDL